MFFIHFCCCCFGGFWDGEGVFVFLRVFLFVFCLVDYIIRGKKTAVCFVGETEILILVQAREGLVICPMRWLVYFSCSNNEKPHSQNHWQVPTLGKVKLRICIAIFVTVMFYMTLFVPLSQIMFIIGVGSIWN